MNMIFHTCFQTLRSITLAVTSTTFLLTAALSSCTTDSYETGEGTYSKMNGVFADLLVNGQKQGVSFVTDDGDNYILKNSVTASWIQTADSTYRTIIYYNKVDESTASIMSFSNLPTLRPKDASMYRQQPQDPLDIESCWITKNGKYMNLGLLIKNGRDSNGKEGIHTVSVAIDEIHKNADNTQTVYYRLLHDQGNAPEYYTNRKYVSVLLPTANRPDSIRLTVKTYNGDYVKTLKM